MRAPRGLVPEVLTGASTVTPLVSVRRGGRPLAAGVELMGATLEVTGDQDVQDKLTLRLDDSWLPEDEWSPFECKGQQAHFTVRVEPDWGDPFTVDRGWFVLDSGKQAKDGITVTGYGLLKLLADDPFVWPSSPAAGATLFQECQRLCAPHLSVVMDAADRSLASGLAWGRDRVEALGKLLDGAGCGMRVMEDGCLHVFENGRGAPTVRYRDLNVLDAYRTWDHSTPNRWVAVGEVSRQVKDGDSYKTVTDRYSKMVEAGPGTYSPESYGVVTKVVEVSSTTGQADVTNAANKALSNSLVALGKRTVRVVPDYRLDYGDVISVVVEGEREPIVGMVTAFQMPCDRGVESMRVDLVVLRW